MTVIPFTLAAAAAADTPLDTVFKVIIAAAPAVIGVTAGVFARIPADLLPEKEKRGEEEKEKILTPETG